LEGRGGGRGRLALRFGEQGMPSNAPRALDKKKRITHEQLRPENRVVAQEDQRPTGGGDQRKRGEKKVHWGESTIHGPLVPSDAKGQGFHPFASKEKNPGLN